MIKGVDANITIRDHSTGAYYKVPVLPPTIPYNDGESLTESVQIVGLGTIEFHIGVGLDSMELASFFPARYDAGYCATTELLKPITYRNLFSSWKDNQTPLQVVCPAAGINKTMRLAAFSWELTGFEGDISYVASFAEKKTVKPKKIAVTVNGTTGTVAAAKQTPANRTAVPTATAKKSYTVVRGDSLYHISKKLGVNPWRTLYEKNKATIGSDPNKLKPGQVLIV